MGIISDLLGVTHSSVPAPILPQSIMPDIAAKELRAGRLPQLNTRTVFLENGEYCRFVDKAILVTETIRTHYSGKHSGYSFRVFKGVRYRTGSSRGSAIKEKVPAYTNGLLYITDKRIIFVAKENGFEEKMRKMTSVTPYSDAIGIQFGGKTYNLLMPQPDLAICAIQLTK